MFKKLRNKFLFINLLAIILVLVISFVSIFLITLGNVKNDVNIELDKVLNQKIRDNNENPPPEKELHNNNDNNNNNKFSPPTISFWVSLNNKREIIEINNPQFIDITDEDIKELLNISNTKNSNSFFKYDDSYWAHKLIKTDIGYKIAFLDVTNNVRVLINFIYAFLIVSFITTIFIYLFSRYFANKAIRPIKEAFEKQKIFVSDASHELKTPLTIINTNIDLVLLNKKDTIKNQEKHLNYIKDEAIRMSKLTNDLLYLSKIDYNDTSTIYFKFNLSKIVENSILPMEAIAFEKQLKLKYDIEPDLFIKGNTDQIKQVCIIILDNAIKYSNEKGNINITLKKQNKEAVLKIENTGIGIDKDHLNNIFERFYRSDESRNRQTGGYGLGLAIAKTIIDKHNGKIKINSSPNQTTAVTITLELTDKR